MLCLRKSTCVTKAAETRARPGECLEDITGSWLYIEAPEGWRRGSTRESRSIYRGSLRAKREKSDSIRFDERVWRDDLLSANGSS